jgi:hypothetical protein
MKVYKKVKEILALVEGFHKELGKHYERLSATAQNKEAAMLLEHLSRRERKLQKGLEKFRSSGQEELSETRIQYVSKDDRLVPGALDLPSEISLDDVVSVAMKLDERLLSFYEEMVGKPDLPTGVREMFRRLHEQAKQEKTDLVQNAEQLKKT